jgi:hypothetical protein
LLAWNQQSKVDIRTSEVISSGLQVQCSVAGSVERTSGFPCNFSILYGVGGFVAMLIQRFFAR